MARTQKISVMVDDSVKSDFDKLATQMGLTSSALGAYVIGSWMMQQKMIIPALLESGKEVLQKAISEDRKNQPASDSGS